MAGKGFSLASFVGGEEKAGHLIEKFIFRSPENR
jgi:hypothetical protein